MMLKASAGVPFFLIFGYVSLRVVTHATISTNNNERDVRKSDFKHNIQNQPDGCNDCKYESHNKKAS